MRHRYIARWRGEHEGARRPGGRDDESPAFLEAAEELSQRGFDYVIFGHTHHPGVVPLNNNRAAYLNPGGWFRQPHYILITDGERGTEAVAWIVTHRARWMAAQDRMRRRATGALDASGGASSHRGSVRS